MDYDDPRWSGLAGAYGRPYDPRPALKRLEAQPDCAEAWEELWNELHHQGDVGEASYAAVPVLVAIRKRTRSPGWNLYALAATIEVERHRAANPPLPEWLEQDYRCSWQDLLSLALDDLRSTPDPLLLRSALSVVALAKGNVELGALLIMLDESETHEWLEEQLGWSALYAPADKVSLVEG